MNLNSSVAEIPLIGAAYQKRLNKLEVKKIKDLIYHLPHKYLDYTKTSLITQTQIGDTVTLKAKVESIKNQYTRLGKKLQIAEVFDSSGQIMVIWFNQPYLIKSIYPGDLLSFSGKIDWFGRKKAIISPEYEKFIQGHISLHTGRLVPIYPETYGVSSKWIRSRINYAYEATKSEFHEFLPQSILTSLELINLPDAIKFVHFPKSLAQAETGRKRLAFNELFFLQIQNLKRKFTWQKNETSYRLIVAKKEIDNFIKTLPFSLTPSQQKTVDKILNDFTKNYPMNRLLEGDVGSGKTVVATIAAFVTFLNGYQSAYMVPTQILAEQHFNTLNSLLQPFKVRIKLLTSGVKKGDLGRSDIFIGTHSLIYNKLDFDKVAFVVIDEQHRFGVEQRTELVKKVQSKNLAPHVLTMTATPIPRTVALTFYGDLDLSTLKELPKGRQAITTWIVPPQKREKAYEWIKSKIISDQAQVFIICPLIEESQAETMKEVKNVTREFEKLKKVFKKLKLGLLHGRLKTKEKNEVLSDFRSRKIDILVSTPVVEVGIDIPNATIMVIEAAERFGLAQLHQLRGRVGRGHKKAYCLLFSETKSKKANTRLSALQKTISGFELAELDLKLRGPGEIFGVKQHGFPELKIASWQDTELIKKAKEVADKNFWILRKRAWAG